jgi:hypothetical protein
LRQNSENGAEIGVSANKVDDSRPHEQGKILVSLLNDMLGMM